MVRISDDILTKLRHLLPEFRDESDANIVRVALRKFIYDQEKMMPRADMEKQFFKLLERIQASGKEAEAKTSEAK
jgi:hypothetical protein